MKNVCRICEEPLEEVDYFYYLVSQAAADGKVKGMWDTE